MSETSEIKKLVDAAHHQPVTIDLEDGRKFVALPCGMDSYKLEQITLPHAADVLMPKAIQQYVTVQTSGSLTTYANRFKYDDTLLLADIDRNSIVCAVDYHAAAGVGVENQARLGLHTATLTMPFSKEWSTWIGSNEKLIEHVEFATFLEENALDVIQPSGTDLLEICRDLQVRQDSHFQSSVRMGDKVSFLYSKDENTTTKDNIELPVEFMLNIPVYFAEPPVMVRCLMRRKIDRGDLYLGYKMVRAENIRQADFQRVAQMVAFDTDLPVIYGKRG